MHENWHDICVDPQTGTIRTDRRALEATAIELQRLVDPFAECAWLRPYLGDEVPDTTLLKFNAGIVKLKEETGLPQITVIEKLEQLRDGDEQTRSRIVGTLRAFKKFIAEGV